MNDRESRRTSFGTIVIQEVCRQLSFKDSKIEKRSDHFYHKLAAKQDGDESLDYLNLLAVSFYLAIKELKLPVTLNQVARTFQALDLKFLVPLALHQVVRPFQELDYQVTIKSILSTAYRFYP